MVGSTALIWLPPGAEAWVPELAGSSRFLSHFSIAREATILPALRGTGLAAPRFYGFHARSASIDDLPPAGIDRPESPEDVARRKYRIQEADYLAARPSLVHPELLLRYGRWRLDHLLPGVPSRLSLVRGDTGPGRYLHVYGRVTALIDWALAHLGDPMLDLGNARIRNLPDPMGDIYPFFDTYAEARGRTAKKSAVRYCTVLSMPLSPLGMAESVQRPTARISSMIPRFGWDVPPRTGFGQALAEALGVELDDLMSAPRTAAAPVGCPATSPAISAPSASRRRLIRSRPISRNRRWRSLKRLSWPRHTLRRCARQPSTTWPNCSGRGRPTEITECSPGRTRPRSPRPCRRAFDPRLSLNGMQTGVPASAVYGRTEERGSPIPGRLTPVSGRRYHDVSGEDVTSNAAVLYDQPGKWQITEIELEPPRPGEIVVRMAGAGLCHSDDHIATGDMPFAYVSVVRQAEADRASPSRSHEEGSMK